MKTEKALIDVFGRGSSFDRPEEEAVNLADPTEYADYLKQEPVIPKYN